jgi:NADH-quinone oxidoreductase subunit L
MKEFLPLLVVLSPFIGFAINGILGKKMSKSLSGMIGTLAVVTSFICSIILFLQVRTTGGYDVKVFDWLTVATFHVDFAFRIDELSTWMMLIISGIGSLIHVYSIGYMHEDEGFARFFAYLNLFIFSMFLLVMGNNFVMLFFGWEGVGLCSYLLIGFWFKNVEYGHAARKAFIMNRIGDLGLLIGIFLIYKNFGTLNFVEITTLLSSGLHDSASIQWITFFLFIGAMGKSAQIPLYTWLPDAMAGPTPVSALIHAATMVTAGVYLVVRNASMFQLAENTTHFILIIGLATSIFAALIGLFQNDIKKVLAYSTVSQLGLMFVALGVGAYTTAMFHLTTHAFFKALLFLGAGSVIHAMSGEQNILKMGGLKDKIKTTHLTFLIGTLAIIGFPLFSGFFSKDEILEKVYMHSPIMWALTLFSAGLTIVYMLRMYFLTFWGSFKGTEEQRKHLHESPISMTFPLVVLAILSLLGGLLNLPHFFPHSIAQMQANWISRIPSLQALKVAEHEEHGNLIYILMGIAIVVVFVLGTAVYSFFKKKNFESSESTSGFALWGANKFYVDELYNLAFVKTTEWKGDMYYAIIEKRIISPFAMSFAKVSQFFGKSLRKFHDGNIESYLLYFIIGIIYFVLLILL